MAWGRRATAAAAIAAMVIALAVPAVGQGQASAPSGDVPAASAPRPPFDTGRGAPITRARFTSPNGMVSCRRVYTENVWLECLLRDSGEIVRFGPDESYVEVPCKAPHGPQTCRLGFGAVLIRPASKADAAAFAGARRVPLERMVELGRRTVPYPACIADPNLGLSCSTMMDDSVGEQIYFGLAGSIWSCPGYEYIDEETAVPTGANRCTVVRP
jgi:hypothetical protein